MPNSLQKNSQFSEGVSNRVEYIPHSNSQEKDDNGFTPRKILSFLLKYKWIIVLFLLAGAAGAWLYAETVTPVYESTGTLMITPGNQSSSEELSKIISQTTGHETSSTFKNEVQVLQSGEFAEQVAQRLLENKPENIEQYPIYWQRLENDKRVHASKGTIAGRIKRNMTFVQPVEEAEVINLNYKSESPKETAKIVNVAMHNYIDHSRQENRQAATSTANFLEGEKKKLKNKLHNAEESLRIYMDSTGIVKVDQQANNMVSQRANTEVELQNVTAKLETDKKSIEQYKKQLNDVSSGLTDQLTEAVYPRIEASRKALSQYKQERSLIVSKNPGVLKRNPLPSRIQYLDKQIVKQKREIKKLSQKLYSKDNDFTGINSEDRAKMVSNLQSKLSELKTQRNQLSAQKQVLTRQKNNTDAEFNQLPEGMVKLAKLKRNVRINEELYSNVSKKYADVSLLEQSKFGFGRIIDPAVVPGTPVHPNKKICLLLGIMLGGMLAVGFIVIREFRDNTVNNVGELKSIYLPAVSLIPKIEKESKENKKSFVGGEGIIPKEITMLNNCSGISAEAIRRLKNNIIFQNGVSPPKSILVTSPEKGDGKSTVAANLAIAFAEEGYWSLLVDADFRRPKLPNYFGVSDEPGLSNYLNDEMPFEKLLKKTDMETLKLMTSGKRAQNPQILSNKQKLKQLLSKMEDVFDVIIIDTPPYGVISDSSALLKYAKSTVLVAQYQKTNKGMLLNTMEDLNHIQANVTNIVLTNFDPQHEVGSYYGNGYYQTMYSNYSEYQ